MKPHTAENIGAVTGAIATITLAQANIAVGMAAGILTILALLPTAISNWKKLLSKTKEK